MKKKDQANRTQNLRDLIMLIPTLDLSSNPELLTHLAHETTSTLPRQPLLMLATPLDLGIRLQQEPSTYTQLPAQGQGSGYENLETVQHTGLGDNGTTSRGQYEDQGPMVLDQPTTYTELRTQPQRAVYENTNFVQE